MSQLAIYKDPAFASGQYYALNSTGDRLYGKIKIKQTTISSLKIMNLIKPSKRNDYEFVSQLLEGIFQLSELSTDIPVFINAAKIAYIYLDAVKVSFVNQLFAERVRGQKDGQE